MVEKNGFIALWYDSEGGMPNWQLPDIPEWNLPGWGDWRFNRTVIRSHGREIIENIVDAGHFPSVHGGYPLQFDNIFTPYSVSQESRIQPDIELDMIQPRGIDFDINAARRERGLDAEGWGVATYHGPSVMYYYTTSTSPEMSYASWWLNYHTPLNNEEVELTSGVIVASLTDAPLPDVWVAVPGENGAATYSDSTGRFKLTFRAHKDSLTTPLNLSREGYHERSIPDYPIPLESFAADYFHPTVLFPTNLPDRSAIEPGG